MFEILVKKSKDGDKNSMEVLVNHYLPYYAKVALKRSLNIPDDEFNPEDTDEKSINKLATILNLLQDKDSNSKNKF